MVVLQRRQVQNDSKWFWKNGCSAQELVRKQTFCLLQITVSFHPKTVWSWAFWRLGWPGRPWFQVGPGVLASSVWAMLGVGHREHDDQPAGILGAEVQIYQTTRLASGSTLGPLRIFFVSSLKEHAPAKKRFLPMVFNHKQISTAKTCKDICIIMHIHMHIHTEHRNILVAYKKCIHMHAYTVYERHPDACCMIYIDLQYTVDILEATWGNTMLTSWIPSELASPHRPGSWQWNGTMETNGSGAGSSLVIIM